MAQENPIQDSLRVRAAVFLFKMGILSSCFLAASMFHGKGIIMGYFFAQTFVFFLAGVFVASWPEKKKS